MSKCSPLNARPAESLIGRSDRGLMAKLADARRRGDDDLVRTVTDMLIASHATFLRGVVARRLPEHSIDDVVSTAVESALRSEFRGTTLAELRSWLRSIAKRRVVDFYRRCPPASSSLDSWEAQHAACPDDAAAAIFTSDVIAAEVARLSPAQRQVVLRFVIGGEPASSVSSFVPGITVSNVFKIAERFRAATRRTLASDEASHAV